MKPDIDPNNVGDLKQLTTAIHNALNGEDETEPMRYVFALMMFPLGPLKETDTKLVSNYVIKAHVIRNMIEVLKQIQKNPTPFYRSDA